MTADNDATPGRVRRDPRAERAERLKRPTADAAPLQPAPPQPAASPAPPSPLGRVRRNPRAERRAPRSPTFPRAETAPAAVAAPGVRIIDDPACLVLAVPDLEDGTLDAHDRDVLGAARVLADASGGAVLLLACLAPGEPGEDYGTAGADRVIRTVHPAFAGYAPETKAAAVAAAIAQHQPRHVLLPERAVSGGDVGRRLATRFGERPAVQVQRIAKSEVACRGNGGASDTLRPPPLILLIAAEAADPVTGIRHEGRAMEAIAVEATPRIEDLGLAALDPNAVPLKEAEFIVSAGNGVTDWDAFHRMAAALGATEGGSRVVCDAGSLPRDRQVGASGTLVEPRCYLAFGIAGAPQHLQGIQRCERVVAVNTDLHADMVKRADLAIIADAQKVMPALARLMELKRRGG
jgi:electron transfer flavoprotein alpha subunit